MNKSRLLLLYRHAIYSHVYSSCTAEKADRERECVCELLIRTVNRSKSRELLVGIEVDEVATLHVCVD